MNTVQCTLEDEWYIFFHNTPLLFVYTSSFAGFCDTFGAQILIRSKCLGNVTDLLRTCSAVSHRHACDI